MNIKTIVILIFSVHFLVLLSCSDNRNTKSAKTEYHSKIAGIISPNLNCLGRGKISEKEAQLLKHYQFKYDTDGKLNSIQFF